MRLDAYLMLNTKMNSKLIKDLNIRCNNIKEDIRERLHDIRLHNKFLNMTLKKEVTKKK